VISAGAFHLAYGVPALACLMLIFLFGLIQLSRVRTSRNAMNIGWVCGLIVYGPQLSFFWGVFGPGAITLWLVLGFWLGLFLVTLRQVNLYLGQTAATLLAPILWLGFEFFRSELYYLKFTWVNAGYAFAHVPMAMSVLGVYGLGFVLMTMATALDRLKPKHTAVAGAVAVAAVAVIVSLPQAKRAPATTKVNEIRVAGVQLEFPSEGQVLVALESLRKANADADVFVLSEYTFDGAVPDKVRAWCRKHEKYLVAGGKDMLDDSRFRNTAFVIGPGGECVFQQAKSMPIQFFKDGLPALQQNVWESPWGRVALPTCYDLSYSFVVDKLARLGVQAIINPTMDVETWGEAQHRMHSRVPLVRAAEYGLPIFRVASSGISQLVAPEGRQLASAPFAVEEAQISGTLAVVARARVPYDRMLARLCVAVTALLAVGFALAKAVRWTRSQLSKPKPKAPEVPASASA
jgi:apolipoprotein N-acyltransferase